MTHNGTSICAGEDIDANLSSYQTMDGYDLLYLLFEVDNLGVTTYVDDNDFGDFSAASGDYIVCAYVELRDCAPAPTPFVDTINDMADIGNIQDGCYNYVCGSVFTVSEDFETLAGTGQSQEDNSTGQNVYIIEVCGGVQPYSIDFDHSGGFASVQEYPSATAGCINYQVTYVDAVDWTLTITDSNNCSDSDVVFTSTRLPSDPLPQITGVDVVPETCPAFKDGSITLTVEGGDNSCAEYSFSASGSNYSSDGFFPAPPTNGSSTFSLEDLASGSYSVTVTDCSGTSTIQNINVSRLHTGGRGGRGTGISCISKVVEETNGLLEVWNVFPNPFTQRATLEFVLSEDAYVSTNIYGVDGRKIATVFEADAHANQLYYLSIDSSQLPTGVYLLQFKMDNGTVYYEKLYVTK